MKATTTLSTQGVTPPGKAASMAILERMLLMRRFEERVFELHEAGHMRGIFHLYIGQEGTGAGVLEAAKAEDLIMSTHRNHGHVVGRGADIGRMYAELMGRVDGLQGGRAGSFHVCDPAHGVLQNSCIVGGCISLAVGAAYGIKQSGGGRVAIGFFGDSAIEEGVAYEALNLATLWQLPVILVCENNSIGVGKISGDSYPRLMLGADSPSRVAEMMGITTIKLANGSNAAEVYAAAESARRHCVEGRGPVFIESPMVRWPGGEALFPKSIGATDLRIALGETAATGPHKEWIERHDPLICWAREVLASGHASRQEIMALDQTMAQRIEAGLQFGLKSPLADPATATTKIFA